MRIKNVALVVSVGVGLSCSSDRTVAPRQPAPPRFSTTVDLSGTGASRLYESVALAINDSGTIVGQAQASATDGQRAVIWQPPNYAPTFLPDNGAASSVAVSIGNDGTIGGRICEDTYASYPCHPVYWRAGVLHQLGGIGQVNDVCTCDGHTLVGRVLVNGRDHGAIWEDDILIDVGAPPGHPSMNLVAVAHGNIVGTAYNGVAEGDTAYETQQRAYRWAPLTGFVSMGFTESGVYDVNSQGSAVGGFSVIWANGSNAPGDIPGEGLPFRINDLGVVGGYCVPDPYGTETSWHPCEWTQASGWFAITSDTTGSFEGLNNLNEAVGWDEVEGRSFAVLWKP